MARHRWGPPVVVEVPLSDAGGSLYTCQFCGTTRQSEPVSPGRYLLLFTAPDGTVVTTGKTPPCQPLSSPD